tara:strand:+ start:198 stop:1565 length:1368 start_codon:yes stop_codon:yes gene_type:complete
MIGEDNSISEAGDFVIEELKIITSAGNEITVTPTAIVLYEDTAMSTISGDMLFSDAIGLSGIAPILGQEFLRLRIRTPSFDSEDVVINYSDDPLAIQSVGKKEYLTNGVELVSINFVANDFLKNMRKKLSKKVEGSYSSIIKKVLKEDIKTRKKDSQLFISDTVGNKKVVIPNLRPFDFIQMAAKESLSKATSAPGFIFFETFRGYVFKSFSDIFATEPTAIFDPDITLEELVVRSGPARGTHDIIKGFQYVNDYEITQGNDIVFNHAGGVYGSKLIVHDIMNKEYKEHTFNYLESFNEKEHLDKNPAFSPVTDEDGKKISDHPVRTFLHPASLKGDRDASFSKGTEYPFAPKRSEAWLQKSISQRIQMEQGYSVHILVRGNTAVSAGDIVRFDVPLPASLDRDDTFLGAEDGHDPLYKGLFFVKRIKHTFDIKTMKHSMLMTLIKDALPTKLVA